MAKIEYEPIIKISKEAKRVWRDAVDIGIEFKVVDRGQRLDTNFDTMKVGDASTYDDVQRNEAIFKALIRQNEKELTQLVILRTRLEQLLSMLDEYSVDETNQDLLELCAIKLDKVLTTAERE